MGRVSIFMSALKHDRNWRFADLVSRPAAYRRLAQQTQRPRLSALPLLSVGPRTAAFGLRKFCPECPQ